MKTIAAIEIERHTRTTITLDIKQQMRQDTIFIKVKEDLRQYVVNYLKQNEQTIQAEVKKNISEFVNLVAQQKMEIKSVAFS
jgi:hypothetical protein